MNQSRKVEKEKKEKKSNSLAEPTAAAAADQ